MLDFNNSLVVLSLFVVHIARENRIKFLVSLALYERVKTLKSKSACCPFAKTPLRGLTFKQAS